MGETEVNGPLEIAYGMGWTPTESWWTEERRCHVYEHDNGRNWWLEIARVAEDADYPGVRCKLSTREQAVEIGTRLLRGSMPFTSESGVDWVTDGNGINHLIPHPPALAVEGNISVLIPERSAHLD